MTRTLWRRCVLAAACAVSVMAAAPVQAQTTALFLDSQPGDWIGQGQRSTWTAPALTVSVSASGRTVSVFADSTASSWWSLEFSAPATLASLTPGIYENAGAAAWSTSGAALRVSGAGRGCSSSDAVGRFRIWEIVTGAGGIVVSFAADFEQHCGDTPGLFGAIRYNSARSSLVPFGGGYPEYSLHIDAAINGVVTGTGIDCGAGRTDCDEAYAPGTSITLQATPSPGYVFLGWAGMDCVGAESIVINITRAKSCTPVFSRLTPGVESPDYSSGLFFLDSTLGTGESTPSGRVRQVYVQDAASASSQSVFTVMAATAHRVELRIQGPRSAQWNLLFGAPSGQALGTGLYQYAVADLSEHPVAPTFRLRGAVQSCGNGGRFEIHELEFTAGVLTRFAADFETPCGSPQLPAAGSIRYRSTRAYPLPFDGQYPTYAVEVVPTVGGYVTGTNIDCGDGGRLDCTELYGAPVNVTLQAFASTGYDFIGWSGQCGGGAAITTFAVGGAVRCFAVFSPEGSGGAAADPSLAFATLLFNRTGGTEPGVTLWLGSESRVTVSRGGSGSIFFSFDVPGRWSGDISFAPPGGALAPGDYEEAYQSPSQGFARLWISDCAVKAGRFRVHEASFASNGSVLTFAADFEALCEYPSQSRVVGAIRFNSTRARILPFDGAYPAFKLTVQPSVSGTVRAAGIDCGPWSSDCVESYASSTTVALQATPNPGYRFAGWTGACDGAASTTVLVDWPRRCSAVFIPVRSDLALGDLRIRNNALAIVSQPGDSVGGGRQHIWLDGEMQVVAFDSRRAVWVRVGLPDGSSWSIDMAAPAGGELRPGIYDNAGAASSTGPRIAVQTAGGYCPGPSSALTGRFAIHELTFTSPASSTIAAFSADFEQRCSATSPALRGSIRYRSSRVELRPFASASVQGPDDVSGDQWADLVLQNRADGQLAAWILNGATWTQTVALQPERVADPAWHVVGRGDANGDGRVDLYWQHQSTGALAVWYMHETVMIGAESLTPGSVADPQWKVRTVADMNRDGSPDLVWQHVGTGHVAVWYMNGAHQRGGELLSPGQVADLDWRLVGAGDVNRDGYPDLFWHHAVTGEMAVWIMRGHQAISGQHLSVERLSDLDWQMRGVGDVDRDGLPDLIWQNVATQQVAVWFLNGLTLIGGRLFEGPPPVLPSADWHVVSPK